MDIYQTHSEKPRNRLLQFFVPTIADVILYTLLGVILLAVLNWRAIANIFHQDTPLQPNELHLAFTQKFSVVTNILNKPVFGKISLLLFWAFVGCLAYITVWFIQYTLATAREDFVEGQYLHPRSVQRDDYWHSVLANNLLLICTLIVSFGYIAILARLLLPLLARVFYIGIYTVPHYHGLFEIVGSIICSSILVYIARLLWQVLRGAWGMSKIPG